MADTPWTKGPWTIWDGDIVAQSDACNPIATLYDDTSDADGNLLASAPDVAEALERLVRLTEFEMSGTGNEHRQPWRSALDSARSALAKARGEHLKPEDV